ncbi:MAG: hypothetical protein Q9173_003389 [Seirophora scorigena]
MILRYAEYLQGFGVSCKACTPGYTARTIAQTYRKCLASNRQWHHDENQQQLKPLFRYHSTSTGQYGASSNHHDHRSIIGGSSIDLPVAQHQPENRKYRLVYADLPASIEDQVSQCGGRNSQVALAATVPERKSLSNTHNFVSWALIRNEARWHRTLEQIRNGEASFLSQPPDTLESRFPGKSEQELLSIWKKIHALFNGARLEAFWQRIILWTLQHDHHKALVCLEATVPDLAAKVGAPRYAIITALEFLTSEYLDRQVPDMEWNDRLFRLFCQFAEASYLTHLKSYHISSPIQCVVRLLLRHSDPIRAEKLYGAVVDSSVWMLPGTLVQFIKKFAQIGRPDIGMNAFKRMAVSPADVSYDVVQNTCLTLLRSPFASAERYRVQSQLSTEILETGIRPEMPLLNAMILNAVEAGDFQTAYAISETARVHGIRRNTITYSTLLKIALHSLDESLVKKIMLMAEEDGALPRNNQLLFCLIATIMQITLTSGTEDSSRRSRYRFMLQIYARYCDVAPLQELGIWVNPLGNSNGPGPISQPSPQLISMMIFSYIRFYGRPFSIKQLYNRYQGFLAQNHPLIAPIAETEHVGNAFLYMLGQNRATFTMCSTILRNMLVPPASTIVKVAKPTTRTWTILLRSYFFNGQRAAGEKIIAMMRERGVEPNIVTMNTIIAGYAGMQDPAAAVNAMQQLEGAGFEADSYTYRGLTRIVKRDELLNALRNVAGTTDQFREDAEATEDSESVENGHVPSPQASRTSQDNLFKESSQLSEETEDLGEATDRQPDLLRQIESRGKSEPSALQGLDFEGYDSYLY